ncbi:regulatory protein GemA [Desulfovibrio desulfuricans]|uniref:phage protein GemA/Gp16 family protein n=1 Tax=Desulfovibrio desulfuricans TaxID=876 RepID=UPI00210985DB|nr:phage protein GemA/Gp16 family protein [Desulfovibrio desulfuricans]MCQ4861142.1 regulatory protein GemA [Desulfovibrio desulfuricans]
MPVIDFRTGQPLQRPDGAITPAPKTPARRKRGTEVHEMRKALLAKVHIAKTQLGMTDDEYATLLESYYNVSSAGVLDLAGLKGLVLVMREYGFKPTKGSAKRKATRKKNIPATLQSGADDPLDRRPLMEKIEALLTEKGRVEGTHVPWGYAVAVLKKQSGGVTRCFEHATAEQLRGVIAALTRDARRKGRRAY